MKRWTLIAALAILAAIGLVPTAANAHDGPAVTATLDVASPQYALAAVTTESGGYELAVLSAYLALPVDNMESLVLQSSDFTPDLNYVNVNSDDGNDAAGGRSDVNRESEHRARDVQRDNERA